MFSKHSVNVVKADQLREAGTTIIDVRTKREWTDAHIPGAVRIGVESIAQRSDVLRSKYGDTEVLVICRSGNRSARAAAQLRALGVTALNVKGGMLAWSRKNLPTTSRR